MTTRPSAEKMIASWTAMDKAKVRPSAVVWLFDSKNLPAVGPASYVHTNLHSQGAQFVFLDGHVMRFKASAYRDSAGNVVTNNPELVWSP